MIIHCKICGKEVKPEYSVYGPSYRRMHEECIIEDCMKTIDEGKTLSKKQYMRLYTLGYNKTEFIEEYALKKPVDWSKVSVDFITLRK